MKLSHLVAATLVGGALTLTACSTTDPEARALCDRIESGEPPAFVVMGLPGFQDSPRETIFRSVEHIRSTCADEPLAESLLLLTNFAPDMSLQEYDDGALDRATEGTLRACMEQTGMTEQECHDASARGEGG